jgi:hypothetical protein
MKALSAKRSSSVIVSSPLLEVLTPLPLDNIRFGAFYKSQNFVPFPLRNLKRIERSIQVTSESCPIAFADSHSFVG